MASIRKLWYWSLLDGLSLITNSDRGVSRSKMQWRRNTMLYWFPCKPTYRCLMFVMVLVHSLNRALKDNEHTSRKISLLQNEFTQLKWFDFAEASEDKELKRTHHLTPAEFILAPSKHISRLEGQAFLYYRILYVTKHNIRESLCFEL